MIMICINEQKLSRADWFAELLSQDMPRATIQQSMGIIASQYDGMLRRLRAKMGAQAV